MSEHDHHARDHHARPEALRPWWTRLSGRLMLLSGWSWVAAGSLIGFEALEMVLGVSLAAPELIPVVILGLALAWFFRERLRAGLRRVRVRLRARRARRAHRAH